MLRLIVIAVAAALLCAGPARAQASLPDLQMRTLTHEGLPRGYGVYAPATLRADQPAALIVALHGRYSSPKALHALSGLAALADARGAVLIYPTPLGVHWNDGGHSVLARREPAADDVGFIAAAIEAEAQRRAIDRDRIFLIGHDTGGDMGYALACQGSLRFAGVAVVSALMWDFAAQSCAPAHAAPLLIVHGRRDEALPARGRRFDQIEARRLGVSETLGVWADAMGCAGARDDGAVYACSSGAALAYIGVASGGHDWFRNRAGARIGRGGLDATAPIDAFFFDRASFSAPRGGGGRPRDAIVYVPASYDPARPTPAVVMLHGRGGNAAGFAAISEMNAVADRRGFIVVYPEGLDSQWNTHFDIVGRRAQAPQDDVGFLEDLMDDLRADLNIDPARQYIAGFSNGGFMTHRMACDSADRFAGFAAVGAALYVEMSDHCRSGAPAPILIMNGTGDPSIPYTGVVTPNPQGGDPNRITLSVQETVAYFIRRNGCELAGTSTTFAERGDSPGTHVVRFAPRGCREGAPVLFYIINGGGHTWPGVPRTMNEDVFGATNMDINASEAIWEFFSGLSLDNAPQSPPR